MLSVDESADEEKSPSASPPSAEGCDDGRTKQKTVEGAEPSASSSYLPIVVYHDDLLIMSDSRPPVPPRPYSAQPPPDYRGTSSPPPIPPLPPNFRLNEESEYSYADARPHYGEAMAAPRPHKLDPGLPANMARTLDEQASYSSYSSPMAPPQPGFAMPGRGQSPMPPPFPNAFGPSSSPAPPGAQGDWSPWNIPGTPATAQVAYAPQQSYGAPPTLPTPGSHYPPPASQGHLPPIAPTESLAASMQSLSFASPPPAHPVHPPRQPSTYSTYGPPPKAPSPPRQANGLPSLTAPVASVQSLNSSLSSIQAPGADPAGQIAWARDVLQLVERQQPNASPTSTDPPAGPARIADAELKRLTDVAVPLVLQLASVPAPSGQRMAKHTAEALYLRGTFANAGSYPEYVPQNPRTAFRDFEQAARNGFSAAWFKLGRDYEAVGDAPHAKDCFERGVKYGVESCLYRMGMAHLLGQLGLPASADTGIPLLQRAATLASVAVPQPAYVYGLMLIDQFAQVSVPQHVFTALLPPGTTAAGEARRHLERAAYLHFAPAQYKLGHAYEFAEAPFPFDPLLSVQYYSLASQQGEVEADMSLSKWFLCGAEGCFDKDEALAYTFAEKAARKGLATAEFAMGYYNEVGVGGTKDLDGARKWYTRAANHGNADARDRLAELSKADPHALSRQEHDAITDSTLVRKRTQAKQRSDSRRNAATSSNAGGAHGSAPAAMPPPPMPNAPMPSAAAVVDLVRSKSKITKATMEMPSISSVASSPVPGPAGRVQHGRTGSGPRHPAHASSMPSGPAGPSAASANPQHRYTLTDSGASPSGSPKARPGALPPSGSPKTRPGSLPPAQGRVPSGAASPTPAPSVASSTSGVKYQTFAEMGIQGHKAEDKDCVIM